MGNHILVVGAVLLDIVGLAQAGQEQSEDKIGSVSLRIGGVAFNVAVNLRELGHDVQLFTCLRSKSPISRIIKDSLKASEVGIRYIIERSNIPEAIFVHLKESGSSSGDYKDFGVMTSSPIEDVPLSTADGLADAIADSAMVVADTNLSVLQLTRLRHMCHASNRKLLVVSASDAKSNRLVEASLPSERFGLVSMNAREAEKIGLISLDENGMSLPTNKIDADMILVSRGDKGAFLFRGRGIWEPILAPDMRGRKIYPTGAGDALFSAICSCIIKGREPTEETEIEKIVDCISRVLLIDSPNLNNVVPVIMEPPSSSMMFGCACCLLCVVGLAFGLSPLGLSAIWIHVPLSLVLASAFGGVGAWVHPLWRRLRNSEKDVPSSSTFEILLGIIIALISTTVATIPNIIEIFEGESPSKSAMRWHLILSMVVGCVSGLSLSEVGRKLIKSHAIE